VVEERVKVFGVARTTRKPPSLLSNQKSKSIVYLPRVRYVNDIKNLAEPLHLKTRRPHFVTGHLRRATEASEKQIFLAQKYGIVVPEGFTFVRPHRRGDKTQETIYRSRSALQCIRALRPLNTVGKKDAWFSFELNVKDWLQRNGFEVEHLAGSRNGDGGVDIQAHKGGEVLLIQCKYWQTVKIGPAVIRELMGTLQSFPKETKGVIITSTELTGGAQKLARKNGIEFLQNVDFNKGIDLKLS
jgi:Holliday junction resolvase